MSTILLVDDDIRILRALQAVLEAEGYGVLAAEDGQIAAALVVTKCPDLIVTDWMMPKVDGMALCRLMKADPVTAGIPLILLSAAFLPLPDEAPWDVLLRKPVPIRVLLDVIAALLDGRRRQTGPLPLPDNAVLPTSDVLSLRRNPRKA